MAITYERKYKDGEQLTCDCYEYPAPLHTFKEGVFEDETYEFCEICSSTYLSNESKSLSSQQRYLCMSLGWIANMLRDEIRSIKEPRV